MRRVREKPIVQDFPDDPANPMEDSMQATMRDLIPDFTKWRKTILNINITVAVITFVMEIIITFILQKQDLLLQSRLVYTLRFFLLPTVFNSLTIMSALLLRRWHPENIMLQNSIPVIAFTVICTVISATHYAFSVTLVIFCLPIFMTAIFTDIKLCWFITGCSLVGLTLALTVRYFLSVSDPYFLQEAIIAYLMIAMAGFLSYTILSMTIVQKNKLINYATKAKQAQMRETIANNTKSTFLANMSHEIRTPINAVLGMNEMILRETEEMQIREYASNIQVAGNSLLSIINDVLDITKIETGKLDIVEVEYETASLIHDSYNLVADRIANKGLAAVVDCDESLPCRLKGDEVRIRQCIVNLLTNAVKYTEKGTVTFSIHSEQLSEQDIRLILSVEDTGIGISEQDLEKLFLQFQRLDLARNRNIEGSGLGLALTRQLTDLMQGEITVKSKYGQGSRFTITLPQKIADKRPMGKFQKDYTEIYQKNTDHRQQLEAPGANILVVDDVPMNLKVIQNLLKNTKINMDTAESGAAFLEIVQKKKYDLIFMDHMMPEMDGMETMARMKKLPRSANADTPVIMLTANVVAGIRDDYVKAGFIDYLPKPVRGDKLENMIRQYLPPHLLNSP